ncbi:MAG TPA: right-handed parallel beta-helix repeat-containing protein, partial [Thermoanaerobaculia bacterium]|nr:right-handed parallel beta-helix repeat-containing protein [Thermoanaerobaculia bacterium]
MRTIAAVLLSLFTLPLLAGAKLSVGADFLNSVDPLISYPRAIRVFNDGPDAARNVVVAMTLPPGAHYDVDDANGWSCTALVCTIDTIAPHTTSEIRGHFSFDASTIGQALTIPIAVSASNGGADFPFALRAVVRNLYPVTTTADSGAGSLRDAIASLNASCVRECRIDFDLRAGSVIEPLTPLPDITACVPVYIGPGPVIEVSGANLSTGHGLVYRATCRDDVTYQSPLLWIRDLAVNRFPWNGIHVAHGHLVCEGCLLSGNRGRGLSVDDPDSFVTIRQSVFGANGRSGLFAWSARQVRIETSTFDRSRSSGIFVRTGSILVAQSTISNSGDFGIAVGGPASMVAFANTMQHNGVQDIDYFLDGPTFHAPAMPDVPEL